ncbi:MAG: S46 family peptidase [Bryobacteraceae bacterium]
MTNRLLCLVLIAGVRISPADEGMWLVNQFPRDLVSKSHGVNLSDSFLNRLQLAAVRFNNGGSGSFVSPNGLVFTNHHVGRDCIQKVSSAQNDYIANGFYANTRAAEKPCPDLELNVLVKIDDVTAKIRAAEEPAPGAAEKRRKRQAEMARLEKECTAATGNRCDVVTLYAGGRYHLYQYRKYTDVRLVFAPEEAIAAFGGDPDNFTFPRYCLDFALFRAYENGSPVASKQYFPWSKTGAREGELAFVPGNPGTTGRLNTLAQLEFSRDVAYPLTLRRLEVLVSALKRYGSTGAEQKRVAGEALLSAENSYKAYSGFERGLRDPQLMGRKRDEEQTLRSWVNAEVARKEKYGAVWDQVTKAYESSKSYYMPFTLSTPQSTDFFEIARLVFRYAEETRKPNGERLREFRDSALESLKQEMFSPAPITDSLEIALLAEHFRLMQAELGSGDELVKAVLDGKTPEEAAARYVGSSKLRDVAERKRLASSVEAVRASEDGMLKLARIFEERNRRLRKRSEDEVEAVVTSAAGLLAQARFDRYGDSVYPDATFTFRITYGAVKGYQAGGKVVPYTTRVGGLYPHSTGVDPFRLPESWLKAKAKLDPNVPFNFVTTCDIHGGNSGSPTVNAKGEIIGIVFDGNIESLPNRFVFTDSQARAVHVAGPVIIESLRKVYGAPELLKELGF